MAVLKLKTAPTVEPISLDEVKAHCRIDANEDDVLLTSLILAARQYVENICGPLINQTWYQYEQDFPSSEVLEIQKPRLSSVTSLKYTNEAGTQSTFSATKYTVSTNDEYWPKIVLKEDYTWPSDSLFNIDPIVIEFICGYGTAATNIPEPLRSACLMLVAHWYEERQPMTVTMARVQDVPLTVDSLLACYRVWSKE
jgi:uncharacterized phiE125 gp8 family phage protein